MGNRLSHSAIEKWKFCNEAWKLHYVEKYRPIRVGGALLFGSALGKAFELGLKKLNDNTITTTIYDEFLNHWTNAPINDVMTDLEHCDIIDYSKYDMDKDLGNTPWESLRTKGLVILKSFETEFLPQVTKVYSTEEKVELTSGEDSSIGFADAVVEIKGCPYPIIIDFKTASRPYEVTATRESVQLSQYLHTLGPKYNTRYCGYVVFLKNLNKNKVKICSKCSYNGSGANHKTCPKVIGDIRCEGEWKVTITPEAKMQIIIDEIDEDFELSVIDGIAEVNDSINAGIINKSLDKCLNDGYGKRCVYYHLCHDGSIEGLVKKEIDIEKKV